MGLRIEDLLSRRLFRPLLQDLFEPIAHVVINLIGFTLPHPDHHVGIGELAMIGLVSRLESARLVAPGPTGQPPQVAWPERGLDASPGGEGGWLAHVDA